MTSLNASNQIEFDESEVSGDPRFLCVREGLTLRGPSQEEARLRCLEFVEG
jgi:hypothetical protein